MAITSDPDQIVMTDLDGAQIRYRSTSSRDLVKVRQGRELYLLDKTERQALAAWLIAFDAEESPVQGRPADHPMPTAADIVSDALQHADPPHSL